MRMTAMTDDETDFDAAVERHRRELHVHCYRMLGSFDEAEDALQETFLRAWRARETLRRRRRPARVAVQDRHQRLPRRAAPQQAPAAPTRAEVPWLQPYPDRLLDEVAPSEEEPDAVVVARETIELTFIDADPAAARRASARC